MQGETRSMTLSSARKSTPRIETSHLTTMVEVLRVVQSKSERNPWRKEERRAGRFGGWDGYYLVLSSGCGTREKLILLPKRLAAAGVLCGVMVLYKSISA